MQFSNDILRQIVLTDNDIFSELKILLDYKDFEKQQLETRTETVEGRIDRYQFTITDLQKENEKLRAEAAQSIEENEKQNIYLLVLLFSLFASIWFIIKLKKLPKIDMPGKNNA